MTTVLYVQLPPCVDHQGHRFTLSGSTPLCSRCGLVRPQAPAPPAEERILLPLEIERQLSTEGAGLGIMHAMAGNLDWTYKITLATVGASPVTRTGAELAATLTQVAIAAHEHSKETHS